jgi:hypothetical protein
MRGELNDSGALDSRESFIVLADITIDWEAPTGGYLLTACFASGRAAGMGMVEWLKVSAPRTPHSKRIADG